MQRGPQREPLPRPRTYTHQIGPAPERIHLLGCPVGTAVEGEGQLGTALAGKPGSLIGRQADLGIGHPANPRIPQVSDVVGRFLRYTWHGDGL